MKNVFWGNQISTKFYLLIGEGPIGFVDSSNDHAIIPLNDHVGQFGVVPAVPGPDDAPQLHVLAELDLAAGLHPRREQLRPRQLPEQPDLGLELVAASAEDGRRLLLHPGNITQSVKYFIHVSN